MPPRARRNLNRAVLSGTPRAHNVPSLVRPAHDGRLPDSEAATCLTRAVPPAASHDSERGLGWGPGLSFRGPGLSWDPSPLTQESFVTQAGILIPQFS